MSVGGAQTITLGFDAPQHIRRIFLHFIARETERAQEFVLRCSSASKTEREIVRQQWTFSPTGSTQEIEEYAVELESMTKNLKIPSREVCWQRAVKCRRPHA
jgi:hypothetical protein